MFVDGQLQFGRVIEHTVQGTPGLNITSKGASARNILFNGINWTLLDGYSVDDMDAIEFSNQLTTATQFSVQRSASFGPSLTFWQFDTPPTNSGVYINATDIDGATNGYLTINMSNTSPSVNGGHVSLSGGAVINGWPANVVNNWSGGNSNWNDPTNWSAGVVPTSTSDIGIACDCASITTPGATTLHSVTISNGNQLQLGGPLTITGDLSVQSGSSIAASANVTILGNVTMDPTASPAGISCSSGSTGAILAGTGTQNVSGKFCRLAINSTTVANGRIYVKNNTAYAGGLIVQNGSLDLNGHAVETDSMYTAGSGTIKMTHALDSLIIHGANVGTPVFFNGGSETGLITNGTVLFRSPNFRANGTAFDASGSNVVIADSTGGQFFSWTGATVGHGFNNLILKNSNLDSFTQTLVVTGTLTLDASMGTSGLFGATGPALFAGSIVDNTGNAAGGFSGAYAIHLTGVGVPPAVVNVDSLIFENGGNTTLTTNLSAHWVEVRDGGAGPTGLVLGGHTLITNNHDFIVDGAGSRGFFVMQNSRRQFERRHRERVLQRWNDCRSAHERRNRGRWILPGLHIDFDTRERHDCDFVRAEWVESSVAHGKCSGDIRESGNGRGRLALQLAARSRRPHGDPLQRRRHRRLALSRVRHRVGQRSTVGPRQDATRHRGGTRRQYEQRVVHQRLAEVRRWATVAGQLEQHHLGRHSPPASPETCLRSRARRDCASTILDSHIFSTISFGAGGEYINNTGTLTWGFSNTTGTTATNFTLTAGQKTP